MYIWGWGWGQCRNRHLGDFLWLDLEDEKDPRNRCRGAGRTLRPRGKGRETRTPLRPAGRDTGKRVGRALKAPLQP